MPVREGRLPAGGLEVAAEAGDAVILVGDGAAAAAAGLTAGAPRVLAWETPGFRAGAWARVLAEVCAGFDAVLLPACPDGRDLAPRLAARLGRPLLAGAVEVGPGFAVLPRDGDRRSIRVGLTGPAVVTVRPGAGGGAARGGAGGRGVRPQPGNLVGAAGSRSPILGSGGVGSPPTPGAPSGTGAVGRVGLITAETDDAGAHDAETIAVMAPDPATMDLSEAGRIVAGGAGLMGGEDGGAAAFALLSEVATALAASTGATRVVTDAGLVPFERQIGTAGTMVSPVLYMAIGVSGAVQHLSGTGDPAHVVAVNLDPSCPMMAAADLGLVTDAPGLLAALARRLGVDPAAVDARFEGGDAGDSL
ncbi:electron transfer flavoprotein alpha subunit [Spinactinospora alkalitolerans]|uniref:Electron transfer flavoprotein alpha subunit n=1 Tax=Spinactinospora alkalitolerans TaxID=687207 RepID=A0A852TZ83_9ACTN|nr:FAD-binding protein [Spinactinospora alkalitolerans]NYE49228.1 electron transfer flavoprotein alpha subunit [Spinactinospora alkalitolerans]